MQTVIGVRLKKAGRIYYYNPGKFEITRGDYVVIDTPRGLECVEVVISPREIADDKIKIGKVVRKATPADLAQLKENLSKIDSTFEACMAKIKEHKLPMNLISVDYSFDASKIVFSFTADGRVDFRDLVKDLASLFHTRIELRQVGVRDEAKLFGGIGCCGRSLCCSTFLGDFIPVSIHMAKIQEASLNPGKISGICGRLMCCLKFESDSIFSEDSNEVKAIQEPVLGMRVIVDEGEGKIISINHQRRTATIILDNSKTVLAPWDSIFKIEGIGEEVKTVVTDVSEEIITDTEVKKSHSTSIEHKVENFNRRDKKPMNQKFSSHKPNVPNREMKNPRDNKKAQKHGRRTEYYQRNKRVHQKKRNNDNDD